MHNPSQKLTQTFSLERKKSDHCTTQPLPFITHATSNTSEMYPGRAKNENTVSKKKTLPKVAATVACVDGKVKKNIEVTSCQTKPNGTIVSSVARKGMGPKLGRIYPYEMKHVRARCAVVKYLPDLLLLTAYWVAKAPATKRSIHWAEESRSTKLRLSGCSRIFPGHCFRVSFFSTRNEFIKQP